jgi:hypothetical protein
MPTDNDRGGSTGEGNDLDADVVKRELFEAWSAANAGGTPQRFEEEWAALTGATPPSVPPSTAPASEDQDPVVMKRRMFEEWIALRPGGTREQFEAEWSALTSRR